jgi:hypothetical protein
MFQKRQDQDEENNRNGMMELETARSSAESSNSEKSVESKKKDEEHMSLFWRVFGGTILSIVALVVITLYNNIATNISDLRTDLSHEREARADLVKKDDFNNRAHAQAERMRAIDTAKVELEGLKKDVQAQATSIEAMKKDDAATSDTVKKSATGLSVLKERITELEAVKKDFTGLDLVKEKLANTATDLKALRDEVAKLTGDLDKNKSADLERKVTRDAQYKQVEETLKEIQKGLQDCREKLARLEGAKPAPSDVKPAGGSPPPGK